MPSMEKNSDELIQELAESLKSTSNLMNTLLSEIQDNSTSLAVLKEKLETLRDNVDNLSKIVRNGNGKGSLVTRLALAEQHLENIEHSLEHLQREIDRAEKAEEAIGEYNRQKNLNRLKIAAVSIPGVISLILMLIKFLTSGE